MKVIRRGVFETNSSSTHSLTLCSEEEYKKWERGEVLFKAYLWKDEDKHFVTKEEAIAKLKQSSYYDNIDFDNEEELLDALREEDYYTMNSYFNDDYLETFQEEYTTAKKEKIIAFGKFGQDG